MKTFKIGIVGCGAIGTMLAQSVKKNIHEMNIAAISDADKEKSKRLADLLGKRSLIASLDSLIKKVDIVVECASQDAVAILLTKMMKTRGKKLVVLSAGGLLRAGNLLDRAVRGGVEIHVPSGAIGGLDALKGAKMAQVDKVTLITSKPPLSFEGAPYIRAKKINLKKIKSKTVLFEGNAREAAKGFPANINVAATLSLVGLGPEKTQVRIIADPTLLINMHEVIVEGAFGRFISRTENFPSVFNPKTSALAAYSALSVLKGMVTPLKVGT